MVRRRRTPIGMYEAGDKENYCCHDDVDDVDDAADDADADDAEEEEKQEGNNKDVDNKDYCRVVYCTHEVSMET